MKKIPYNFLFLPYYYYYGTTATLPRMYTSRYVEFSYDDYPFHSNYKEIEKKQEFYFTKKKLNGVVIKVKTLKLVTYAKCGRYVFCINLLKFKSVI